MKKNGWVLGVLGGMGPAATAEFLRLLAAYAPAATDQDHPAVLLWGDTDLPDRSAAMLGLGPSPEQQMYEDFEKLTDWGADLLCAPCNSAHYFINRFRGKLRRPLVHIVEVTVAAARAKSPTGAWLLGTQGTLRTGLYQEEARRVGYALHEPSVEIGETAEKALREIKANRFDEAGRFMRAAVEALWAEQNLPIVLACTELPLAYQAAFLPKKKAVSSLEALAQACLKQLYTE